MKKFLALLGVLTLTTTAAASVVGCSARVNKIENHLFQDFDSGNPERNLFGNDYNKDQFANATTSALPISANNLAQLFNPVAQQGNRSINNDIFNVLNYSHRKVVKPNKDQNQLRTYRDQLAGREAYKYDEKLPESERYMRASADGVYMPKMESSQESQDKYYQEFKTTAINSIEGLYNLNRYTPSEGVALSEVLQKLQGESQTLFADDSHGKRFAELFLGITKNPAGEAAYTDVSYNTTDKISDSFTENPTKVTTFNQAAALATIATDQDYKSVNNKSEDHDDQDTKRVNERPDRDPFNRLVLKAASGQPVAVAPKTLEDVTNSIEESKRNDWNDAWDNYQSLIQLTSTDKVYVYNAGKDDKFDWKLVPHQYFYVPTIDLKIKFKFATNAKHHDKGDVYNINFTAKNLAAVWEPIITPVQVKDKSDDQKKDNFSQVTWVFRGYKFSKGMEAYKEETEDASGLLGFKNSAVSKADNEKLKFELTHRFSDMAFSDGSVTMD